MRVVSKAFAVIVQAMAPSRPDSGASARIGPTPPNGLAHDFAAPPFLGMNDGTAIYAACAPLPVPA